MMKLSKKIPIYVAAFLSPWFVFFCGGGEFFTAQSGWAAFASIAMIIITFVIISIGDI